MSRPLSGWLNATGERGMRRVEPDPDESRRKLWRAENSLTTHARCSPPGLSRIASLIGKIQACRPVDHSSGANGCRLGGTGRSLVRSVGGKSDVVGETRPFSERTLVLRF